MAKKQRIIKNGYVAVVSGEKLANATVEDYVYEHRLIAEEILDRPLKEGEEVHHLDENKQNNSPDNLLVLSGPMHAKLHTWLQKNEIKPKADYAERIKRGCVRCNECSKPIDASSKFCSTECATKGKQRSRKFEHPDKETLEKMIWSKPTTQVAKDFGVSDKAIEKLCKKLEIEKPPIGYWNKVNAGLIAPLPLE